LRKAAVPHSPKFHA